MSPELLTVLVALASCVAFCLMILMLVVVLLRKDPLCCRFITYRAEHTDDPPHFHSRHSLIGISQNEHSASMSQGATGPQLSGRLSIIGKPDDYHLNGALPRLPSYDSVCRKDRQRQIHSMISQRVSLSSGCNQELRRCVHMIQAFRDHAPPHPSSTQLLVAKEDREDYKNMMDSSEEPPPTYEETLRQSFDISPADLRSLDLVYPSIHPQDHSSNLNEDTHTTPVNPPDSTPGTASLLLPST